MFMSFQNNRKVSEMYSHDNDIKIMIKAKTNKTSIRYMGCLFLGNNKIQLRKIKSINLFSIMLTDFKCHETNFYQCASQQCLERFKNNTELSKDQN